MPLSPLQPSEERAVIETNVAPETSKTYQFDFSTGEFTGQTINEDVAIRQFIRKATATARFRFTIYDFDYGCEIEDLIGLDLPLDLTEVEIKRVIKEALIFDDRIADVTNIDLSRDGDKLVINFNVNLASGAVITEEVTI
jgi:hypothetical protein